MFTTVRIDSSYDYAFRFTWDFDDRDHDSDAKRRVNQASLQNKSILRRHIELSRQNSDLW